MINAERIDAKRNRTARWELVDAVTVTQASRWLIDLDTAEDIAPYWATFEAWCAEKPENRATFQLMEESWRLLKQFLQPTKAGGSSSVSHTTLRALLREKPRTLRPAPSFRVFLSYSRPDMKTVLALHGKLLAEGIAAWMDVEDIRGGDEWELAIDKSLRESQLVLVFLSKNAVTRSGHLQKEIKDALAFADRNASSEACLIPVMLDDCPIHEQLQRFQHVSLVEKHGLTRLTEQIKEQRRQYARRSSERKPAFKRSGARAASENTSTVLGALPPSGKRPVPLTNFPGELLGFIMDSIPLAAWSRCTSRAQEQILTLGCKLEPIVQIAPVTASPLVVGFECLALGAQGEDFAHICEQAQPFDRGLLHICMSIAAIKTVAALREKIARTGRTGVKNLKFSINLDPYMLDSPRLMTFLEWYHHDIRDNIIFEVNEKTTTRYLTQLRNMRADFELRYAADDLNRWGKSVRSALINHVEMTKMDCKAFRQAMRLRGEDPSKTLVRLCAEKVPDKPLVVEGVEELDYVRFLELAWSSRQLGELYGQGHSLECGLQWEGAVESLKPYGFPGGGFFRKESDVKEEEALPNSFVANRWS